jgi:hypothetical protein
VRLAVGSGSFKVQQSIPFRPCALQVIKNLLEMKIRSF